MRQAINRSDLLGCFSRLSAIKKVVLSGWSMILFSTLLLAGYVAPIAGSWFATRALDPKMYGQFLGLMLIPIFCSQLIFGQLGSATLRYGQLAQEATARRVFCRDLIATLLATSAIVLLIVKVSAELLIRYGDFAINSHDTTYLVALIASASGASHVAQQDMLSRSLRARYACSFLIESWLKVIALVIGVTRFSATLETILQYQAIAFFLSLFLSLAINISSQPSSRAEATSTRKPTISSQRYESMDLIRYALHFSGWGIFTSIYTSADKWFLLVFCSAADLGIYSVAYQFAYTPVAVLSGIMLAYLTPKVFSGDFESHASQSISRQRNARSLSLILATLILLTAIFYIIIFGSFVGAQFRGGIVLVPPLLLSAFAFSAAEYLSLKLMQVFELKRIMLTKISYSICGSLLLWIGSVAAGALGVAIASAMTSFFYLYLSNKSLRPANSLRV